MNDMHTALNLMTTDGYDYHACKVGRLTSVTDALNQTINYTYDQFDRITGVTQK